VIIIVRARLVEPADAEMHSWYISERKESIGKTHAKSTTRAEDHMVVTDQNHQPIYDGNHKREKRVSISYEHWLTLFCVVPFFLVACLHRTKDDVLGNVGRWRISGCICILLVSCIVRDEPDRFNAEEDERTDDTVTGRPKRNKVTVNLISQIV
jgi:hypothetical protein